MIFRSSPGHVIKPSGLANLLSTASKATEAAICFYKALKVYPTPNDLINIYDKTVSKVRAILALPRAAEALQPASTIAL